MVIGTLVSSSVLLASLVAVPVTFVVLFAGALEPNAAAGRMGALLAFVLPASSGGTAAMIPERLAGTIGPALELSESRRRPWWR